MTGASRRSFVAALLLAVFAPVAWGHASRVMDQTDLSYGTHTATMFQDGLLTISGSWSSASTPLSRRSDMGMDMDISTRKILLFGGLDEMNVALGDTWEKDPSGGWVQISPSTAPCARYGHEVVWIGNKFLLFGGLKQDGTALDDTWLYDPGTQSWTPIVGSSTPEARGFYSAAYSSHTNQAVLFGGSGSSGLTVPDSVWIFNVSGSSWTQTTPSPRPSARRGAAMTYDVVRQKMFLFGGRGNTWNAGDLFDDTWSYDPASRTWEDRSPSTPPNAVAEGELIYDFYHDRVVLYGGNESPTSFQEGMYFYDDDGPSWEQLILPTTPAGRSGHKMVYDSVTQKGLSFGGRRSSVSSLLWSYQIASSATWTSDPVQISGSTPIDWFDFSVDFADPYLSSAPAPGTNVLFQISSSSDGINWGKYEGPDGSSTTYYVVQSSALQSLDARHDGDRYLSINAILATNDFPARPKIQTVTFDYNQGPSQGVLKTPADGTVTNESKPTFAWELSADNDGPSDLPLLYNLQIAGTTDFATIEQNVTDIPKDSFDVSYTLLSDLGTATWYWRVRAKDVHGLYGDWSGSYSLIVDTITPPDPVTKLSAAMGASRAEIDLTWTFPGDDDGRLDNGTYIIRYSSTGAIASESDWAASSGEQIGLFSADPGESIMTTVTGLDDGTTYYLAIKTEDELGNRSSLSTVSPFAKTQSPPSPIQQMTASKGPGSTDVSLNWTFPGQDGNALSNGTYHIRYTTTGAINSEATWSAAEGSRSGSFSAAVGDVLLSVVTGLDEATTYYFAMKTEDAFGQVSALSLVSPSLRTNGFPLAVTSLSGQIGPGNNALTLTWTFPGDFEGSLSGGAVLVHARITGPIANESDWSSAPIETVAVLNADPGDPIQTILSGLNTATTYYVSIRVRDDYQALGPVPALSPAVLTNAPPSVGLIYPTGGETLSGVVPIQWSSTDPNPGDTRSFELDLSVDGGASYPIVFSTALPNGTTYYNWNTANLPPNTEYRIRVKAVDAFGLSGSDESSSNLSKTGSVPPPTVAFTSSPAMGELVSGVVPISWEVPSPNPLAVYSYTLSASDDGGVTFTTVYVGSETSHNWASTDFTNGQNFVLRITAFDSSSPSQSGSADSTVFWVGNPLKPDDFQLLYPLIDDFPSAPDLVFRWVSSRDPDGGSLSYRIEYSTNPDLNGALTAVVAVQTDYSPPFGSLSPDRRYYWRVTAISNKARETETEIGYFDYLSKKARTTDGFITVELLSSLPASTYLTLKDAAAESPDLIEKGDLDSKGDRLIKVLSMPAWKIYVGDASQNVVPDADPEFRLTFHLGAVSTSLNQSDPALDPANIRVARLDQNRSRWELLENQSKAKTASADMTASASGDGIFTVVAAPSPIDQLSGLTNFPNPFSPLKESTRIRYVLTENSEVTVRIFNTLGDLVKTMSFPSGSTGGQGSSVGFTNEITWDGKNDQGDVVTNGVYLAVIKAESSDENKEEIRRIGVLK